MFGKGLYFATDSSKSAQNVYTKGSEKLLLCNVLLGKTKIVVKDDNTMTGMTLTLNWIPILIQSWQTGYFVDNPFICFHICFKTELCFQVYAFTVRVLIPYTLHETPRKPVESWMTNLWCMIPAMLCLAMLFIIQASLSNLRQRWQLVRKVLVFKGKLILDIENICLISMLLRSFIAFHTTFILY